MNELNGVSTEWVKLCPLLEVKPAHPGMADSDEASKSVMEIYDYFKATGSPMASFKEFYNRLPIIPKNGETKLSQVLKAIRLMKISKDAMDTERNTRKALKHLGIK